MVGFLEMTPAELAEVPTAAELTAIELRSVLLALGGDTFGPDSIYANGLTTATEKMERMLDDVRVRISRTRRGLPADATAE
ncbi:hypothetical protein PK69_01360 [Xanthomonas phaseoli pv. phaseoli]|uniref:hypothetical protein n=1 Tax=Xanthomonas phaseoli TaxID=1985254 RepID=UPI0005441C56|nr:hypothetical protein [Xanthomonas phaseoli]KHD71740.1 hypothetical protein PK69_01360 [Xanthomonas phaseoli pv. phaseoli]